MQATRPRPSGWSRRGSSRRACSALATRWIEASGFKGNAKQQTLLPGPDGGVAGVLLGMGDGAAGEPSGPSELLIGQLAQSLPAGTYRLQQAPRDPTLAAMAWGLGAYRFVRYKASTSGDAAAPGDARRRRPRAGAEHHRGGLARPRPHQHAGLRPRAGRDAEAVRALAGRYGAHIAVIEGDDLLGRISR